MFAILGWLGSFLMGPVTKITEQIVALKQQKLAAETDEEKLRLDAQVAVLEQRKAVLISEQGWWFTAMIRPLFALPFVIFNFKVIVWDKVLGWGVTDELSPNLISIELTIIAAYFLTTAIDTLKRR